MKWKGAKSIENAKQIQDLLDQMTLEQKCALLSGKETFSSRAYDALKIPSILFSDGPHGLRKQIGKADHLGLGASEKATCFPTAATIANSWDVSLGARIGEALGIEAATHGVSVVLGPGLNIKRNPLCGRNFEYFSEDPYLSGKMAAAYVKGIQKNGIAACPKHFAVNNQEAYRMVNDSVVDERTLREIYLTGFEIAIKEANPKSIMTAYNLVNGVYSNESAHLLIDILREEWGFDGSVITDWGGSNDHVEGVKNGSTIEMPPAGSHSIIGLVEAVKKGQLKESIVDERVRELLRIVFETHKVIEATSHPFDVLLHHNLARKAAGESIVLLKNKDGLLPLGEEKTVCIIGDFAEVPRYQGAGSSVVNPTQVDTMIQMVNESGLKYMGYAQGFLRQDKKDHELLQKAVALAKKADVVLYCMGLDEMKECEGIDRSDLRISQNQIEVLQAISSVNSEVVAILSAGGVVEMPWIENCKALVYSCLGGQAGSGAVFDVITGKLCPSGKLAETYPLKYEDVPSAKYFPGKFTSEYREGIYVGYRYYDISKKPVLFPFGFGLSYTTFDYRDLKCHSNGIEFTITNTGCVDAAEIAQLYIGKNTAEVSQIFRAVKELKGFEKVFLKAGESKTVNLLFDDKTFRYFNTKTNNWEIEAGAYQIMVGASSVDIRLKATLQITGSKVTNPYQGKKLKAYESGQIASVSDEAFSELLGHPIPKSQFQDKITRNTTLGQLIHCRSPIGWLIWCILYLIKKISELRGKPNLNVLFMYNMPLRALAKMTNGAVSMSMVDGIVMELKGYWFIGLGYIVLSVIKNKIDHIRLEKNLKKTEIIMRKELLE